MQVEELGEFGLISRLDAIVRRRQMPPSDLVQGIGDDAAIWRRPDGTFEMQTTDSMVAGVHFLPNKVAWKDVGWKVAVMNLSDLAAMGSLPRYAIATLGIPQQFNVGDIEDLYNGMLDCLEEYSVALVGGDIVSSDTFFVTIAITGTTSSKALLRNNALPGDHIVVTGHLGSSAGGLKVLKSNAPSSLPMARELIRSHVRPIPRVYVGQTLLEEGVKAAIDVSDGLIQDLTKICFASGVAAQLNAATIPMSPALTQCFPDEALTMALTGGEEFELLFTASPNLVKRLIAILAIPVTTIGEILQGEPGNVEVLDSSGTQISLDYRGWDHFRTIRR